MFRNKLISLAIRFLERDLERVSIEILSEEQNEGLLSMLWDNSAFRNHVKDRNERLIHAIAGVAGNEIEPRDKTRLLLGQRVENLLLASKAKACAVRRDKRIKDKRDVDKSA